MPDLNISAPTPKDLLTGNYDVVYQAPTPAELAAGAYDLTIQGVIEVDENDAIYDEICRHCNNYFNPKNDINDPARNYPASFKRLAGKIAAYVEAVGDRQNIVQVSLPGTSVTHNLEYASWQKAFARELSIWKRVRFI